ncbi:MAG: hypothetical protein Q8L53_16720 [Aestuariivirga sp.]|nr:hypothetical protein [Aestuariivirga sp.]
MAGSSQSGMGFNSSGSGLLGVGGQRGSYAAPAGLLGMGGPRGSLTAPPVTSMFAEAQRRAAANRLREQYSQYRSPPPMDGAEDLTRNAYMADQYAQYRSPPNVNTMAPQSPGGLERYADARLGGKFGVGSTQSGIAPQSVTDPYGGMGKFGMNSGQTSPYNEVGPSAPTRYAEQSAPPVVARIGEDGRLSMVKDQSRLSGMEGPSPADRISYPSEEGQIYSPAPLSSYMPNLKMIRDRVKEQARLPQEQPNITAQNYGFQGPQPSPADMAAQQRASYVDQWRGNQMANNSIHQGLGQAPAAPAPAAGIDPAVASPPSPQAENEPSLWEKYAPDMLKAAVTAVDEKLIQPTQEQIDKYGGFKRAGELAKAAVAIMNFMPGGDGLKNTVHSGNRDRMGAAGDVLGGGSGENAGGQGPGGNPAPAPVAPPSAPPVNQAAQWSYPQYTQSWAGLPTGIGGPVWRPTPPSAGLFQPDKKKKKA